MALILSQKKKFNCVRIISKQDSALDLAASDWDKYQENPIENEASLKFKEGQQPTIFICNFDLSGIDAAEIKDAMIKGIDEESKQLKLAYGRWAYMVVKLTLKEIQNPTGIKDVIELKKDSHGHVDGYTMSMLEQFGMVQEIFSHFISLTHSDVKAEAKN